MTWRRTRRVQIALLPSAPSPTANASLRAIAAGIGAKTTGATHEVIAAIAQKAGALDSAKRKDVVELFRETGYESADPSLIVADLLAVTGNLR